MKLKLILAIGGAIILASSSYVLAEEGHEGHDHGTNSLVMAQQELEAANVGNTICPVSGDKIKAGGEMGEPATYVYNGKTYNLCCPACSKDFKKDPEKYSKIAEDEVKSAVQN